MKLVFGFALASLLAFAYGEDCFEVDECVVTACGGGNSVVCELPSDGGTGKCTCATVEACSVREDCYSPEHPELDCEDSQRHCYDARCICSWFGGGGSIGGGGFPGK